MFTHIILLGDGKSTLSHCKVTLQGNDGDTPLEFWNADVSSERVLLEQR